MSTIFLALGKMCIGPILEHVGEIHRDVAICDFDAPPSLQRREHHEPIGRAIALILVIVPCGLSWFRLDRNTRFADQLLRCLVHADDGLLWTVRPMIYPPHSPRWLRPPHWHPME
jgi:hypothetical protein